MDKVIMQYKFKGPINYSVYPERLLFLHPPKCTKQLFFQYIFSYVLKFYFFPPTHP